MVSSGMLGRVALVRTDVSEELSASFIRVTRIGELGTTLAVTSNRRLLVQLFRFLLSPYSLVGTCNTVQNCTFRDYRNILQLTVGAERL
jgi:hypothetical protein